MKKIALAGLVLALLAAPAYAHWGYGAGYGMTTPWMMGPGMMGYSYYGYPGYGIYVWDKLTDEQRAAIQDRIRELQEKGAYPWEIRAEVYKLLREYGALPEVTPYLGYGMGWGYFGCH
jgi:hypothetical protein